MSLKSIAYDPSVQKVLRLGMVFGLLGGIAIIAGIATGRPGGGPNFFSMVGSFLLVVWGVSVIVVMITAAFKKQE